MFKNLWSRISCPTNLPTLSIICHISGIGMYFFAFLAASGCLGFWVDKETNFILSVIFIILQVISGIVFGVCYIAIEENDDNHS